MTGQMIDQRLKATERSAIEQQHSEKSQAHITPKMTAILE